MAVHVTVGFWVVPVFRLEIVGDESTASKTCGPPTGDPGGTDTLAVAVMVGAVVSTRVTVCCAVAEFPASSVAIHVIIESPSGRRWVGLAGIVIVGGVVSLTTAAHVVDAELFEASVAVHVMRVMPALSWPGESHVTLVCPVGATDAVLPKAAGGEVVEPAAVVWIDAGEPIVGDVVSATTTACQAETVSPEVEAVHFTSVTPLGSASASLMLLVTVTATGTGVAVPQLASPHVVSGDLSSMTHGGGGVMVSAQAGSAANRAAATSAAESAAVAAVRDCCLVTMLLRTSGNRI
ncbi:MAG: hypothetical protein EB824_05315 [Thaumarchaeota archaeon S15]|nr:MAG: hypothetical protein EB824_05315 [Thaumarchaeota archaeon S15]